MERLGRKRKIGTEEKPRKKQKVEIPSRSSSDESSPTEKPLHSVFTQKKFRTGLYLGGEPLASTIKEMIDASPDRLLPWSKFMETSLFDPESGYYSKKAKIGFDLDLSTDFSTWPEDLPSFGAHIEQSLFNVWLAMNKPSEFQIVEMGAGNGSLAYSLLDWAKKYNPDFYDAIKYQIIDQSPTLIEVQQEKLSRFNVNKKDPRNNKVTWIEGSAIDLPVSNIKGAIISNELPDAFPVERVTSINGKIVQKYVTLEYDESSGKYEWVEVWSEPTPEVKKYIDEHKYKIEEGVEEPINLAAAIWQKNIALALEKGALLTIDYGKRGQVGRSNKSSVRNFGWIGGRNLKLNPTMFDSYEVVGGSDITSDIDFAVLEKIAIENGLKIAFSDRQSEFLLRNGLDNELKKLKVFWDINRTLNDGIRYQEAARAAAVKRQNGFYVSMATRGIDSDKLVGDKSNDEFEYPELEIPLPDNTKKVKIVWALQGRPIREYLVDCGPTKPLTLTPKQFPNTVIYEMPNEKVLYRFERDTKEIDEFINRIKK